jgi:hypothetical protein
MHPLVLILLFGFILSLPKVPHLIRWGFGKERLKYIGELKSRGQYDAWKKENKYFLLAENICNDGVIFGILLSFVVGYFYIEVGVTILLGTLFLGIAGVIVSLILDSKIPN